MTVALNLAHLRHEPTMLYPWPGNLLDFDLVALRNFIQWEHPDADVAKWQTQRT
jgi:hypothetical protein